MHPVLITALLIIDGYKYFFSALQSTQKVVNHACKQKIEYISLRLSSNLRDGCYDALQAYYKRSLLRFGAPISLKHAISKPTY